MTAMTLRAITLIKTPMTHNHKTGMLIAGILAGVVGMSSTAGAETVSMTVDTTAATVRQIVLPDIATPLRETFDAKAVLAADDAAARNRDVAATAAMPATAIPELSFTTIPAQRILEANGHATEAKGAMPPRAAASPKAGGRIVTGSFIAKDFVYQGDEVNCVMTLTADATDATMVHISNFYGLEETVDAVIDVTAGTVSIMPQRIWQSKSYGDVYLFPIEIGPDGIKYFTQQPVTGTIDANGVITLGRWGAIVGYGDNQGTLLAAIDHSSYHPANASMAATLRSQGTDRNVTYPLLVEQPSQSEIVIYNFGTTGVAVKARVDADKNISVSEQYIANVSLYGAFNCRPIDPTTGVISKTDPVMGKLVGTDSITFEPWCAASVLQDGLVALYVVKSGLKSDMTLTAPPMLPFNLQGSGTAASPYLIKTPADMMTLSQNAQRNSFVGKHFRLENDIDMSGTSGYLPIGLPKVAFGGIFDGNSHSIVNFTLDGVGYNYQGLFGVMYEGSKVSDLTLKNVRVNGNGYYLGGIAGYAMGDVVNCRMEGQVTGAGIYVGGVVGRSYKKVDRCSSSGLITGSGHVGGVIGYSFGPVSSCRSDATVKLPAYYNEAVSCLGGITGLSQSYSLDHEGVISDCMFTGTVENGSGYGFTGGIFGYVYSATVDRCLNVGRVMTTHTAGDTEAAGGIAGIARDCSISDCLNAGLVTEKGYSTYAGGLIGYISTAYSTIGGMLEPIKVSSCINVGQVFARNRTATAGIFGSEFTSTIVDDKPSDTGFSNTWYDAQALGIPNDAFGRPTSFFTGTLGTGFSASVWEARSNRYPALKCFSATDASTLASACVTFSGTQTARAMKADASLSEGTVWSVRSAEAVPGLSISGNTLRLGNVYANDTVAVAVNGLTAGRLMVINAVPKLFDGEGTAQSPFLIKNKADFQTLHNAVMHYDHEGDHFLQTADVDFGLADDFQGVAAGNHLMKFAGIFDGGNHLIKGLKIEAVKRDAAGKLLNGSYNYGGLFHIGTPQSVIRNVVIDAGCSLKFYGSAGAVIGYTSGKVENCRNYADILTGGSRIGGIVGQLEGDALVTGCYNAGTIREAGDYAGGIAGSNMADIAECQNDGDIISGGKYAGGIAGASAGSVTLAVNNGAISGADYVGGIIGSISDANGKGGVSKCISSGMVSTGGDYFGGVVGYANGRGNIEHNYFDGSVNIMSGCSSLSRGFAALSTSELTGTELPEGLDAAKFAFRADAYPSLKAFDAQQSGIAPRAIFLRFEKDEKRSNVLRATPLSANADIVWSLKANKDFGLSGGNLTITLPENAVVADTLVAVHKNGYTKEYALKSIPAILEGNGSDASPFRIKSADDLTLLANFMASSGMDYDGYFFRVENDIVYPDTMALSPIARTGVQFQGDFNGNGKTISAITFLDETTKTGKNIGLFGTVGTNGKVHDLTLEGKIKAASYVGSFAGLLYGSIDNCVSRMSINGKSGNSAGFAGRMYDGASITNSLFEGSVSDEYSSNYNYIAGFAAQVENGALIENCVNKGNVGQVKNTTGTTWTGQQYVGGIAGMNLGTIRNCRNQGVLNGRMHVGGIAGRVGKTGRFEDCVNEAPINVEGGGYVGGIAPQTAGSGLSYIIRCGNTASLRAKGYVGGIIGAITNGCTVDSCYNTGSITSFSSTGYAVGGIIGQMQSNATYPSSLSNSWNSGAISGESSSVGGVAGKVTGGQVVADCHNTGKITVKIADETNTSLNGVGGVFGSCCATATRIWNSGDIESNMPSAAGVIGTGAMPIARISHAVNFGNVTVTRTLPDKGYCAGGIWGGYGPASLSECYNYGAITAPDNVGGINPALHSNGNGGSTVERCFNLGKVTATADTAKFVFGVAGISRFYDKRTPIDPSLMTVNQTFYADDVCTHVAADTLGTKLTRAEMMTASLGEAFTYRKACFPTLAFVDDVPLANLHAVYMQFADGDTADNVNNLFNVGIMPHVSWTVHPILVMEDDGVIRPDQKGEGWVTATTDEEEPRSKTYAITVMKTVTGIDDMVTMREVTEMRYFTLDGLRIEKPQPGVTYILNVLYRDGGSETKKVIFTR